MRIRVPSLALATLVLVATAVGTASPARAEGGVWQSPDSLAGLVGSYTRPPLAAGPIAFVTLGGTDGYRAQGPYTRFFDTGGGILAVQKGTYGAIANNPAIGAAIFFNDEAGNFRDFYSIIGIQRDPLGRKIIALELIDARDGHQIVLTRVGL